MKLILALTGFILGVWLVWPSAGQEPGELEPAPRVAVPDSVPAPRYVTHAELDSIILEMHKIYPPPQCWLPWQVGPPYCGVTVGPNDERR